MSLVRSAPLFLALMAAPALAAPVSFTHQGRLLDAAGVPLDGTQELTFRLYDAPAGGAPLWEESQSLGFDLGHFAADLGADPSNLIDDALLLDSAGLYLALAVGGGAELPTRIQLVAVPFARVARNVSGGTVDATSIAIDGDVIVDGGGGVHASSVSVGGQTVIDSGGGLVATSVTVNGVTVIDGSGAVSAPIAWADLHDVPGGLDEIGSLACVDGEVLTPVGGAWACLDPNTMADPLSNATASEPGLMSAADKAKLDAIEGGATGDATADETLAALNAASGTIDGARLPAVLAPMLDLSSCSPGDQLYVNEDGDGWTCERPFHPVDVTFGTCGASGRSGPSQSDCDGAYGGGVVSVTAGYQVWTVPYTGTYQIVAAGAQGGRVGTGTGGKGAIATANFSLEQGDKLVMVVGHEGASKGCSDWGGGGGGGTYVARVVSGGDTITPLGLGVSPLVVGGGGAATPDNASGCTYTAEGGRGFEGDGSGGTGGNAGGGGGYRTNGGGSRPGLSFLNGATGGLGSSYQGGFGGGGGPYNGAGAGGGWSGGSVTDGPATAGSSYSSGSGSSVQTGAREASGSIRIVRQ